MYAKSLFLVTAAVTTLIAGGILSSSNITSVYAKPTDPRFCYTFTSIGGKPVSGEHAFTLWVSAKKTRLGLSARAVLSNSIASKMPEK